MDNRRMTLEEAKTKAELYPYALIYRSNGIQLGETANVDTTGLFGMASYEKDGNLEARFFSEEGELHVFALDCGRKRTSDMDAAEHMGRNIRAVATTFAGMNYIDERFVIGERFRKTNNDLEAKQYTTLVVRRILDQDEDGQTFVKQTCLAGLEA